MIALLSTTLWGALVMILAVCGLLLGFAFISFPALAAIVTESPAWLWLYMVHFLILAHKIGGGIEW